MRNTNQKGAVNIVLVLCIAAVLAAFGLVSCSVTLNARSQCIAAEAGLKAQLDDNKNVFDNAWKEIKESAQVTSEFVRANDQLLRTAVQGRSGAAGELVRLIHEANPALDPSVFLKVQRSIETAHARFSANQTALLDRKAEYEKLYQSVGVMYANLFLSPNFPRINMADIKIVTSDETEKAFSTGKSHQLNVFGSDAGL